METMRDPRCLTCSERLDEYGDCPHCDHGAPWPVEVADVSLPVTLPVDEVRDGEIARLTADLSEALDVAAGVWRAQGCWRTLRREPPLHERTIGGLMSLAPVRDLLVKYGVIDEAGLLADESEVGK